MRKSRKQARSNAAYRTSTQSSFFQLLTKAAWWTVYVRVYYRPWPCNYGPKRDNYNLGYNPQFSLFTNVKGSRPCGILLLLSKHITVTEENRDFITLHVFDVQKQPQNQTAAALLPSTRPPTASGSGSQQQSNTIS